MDLKKAKVTWNLSAEGCCHKTLSVIQMQMPRKAFWERGEGICKWGVIGLLVSLYGLLPGADTAKMVYQKRRSVKRYESCFRLLDQAPCSRTDEGAPNCSRVLRRMLELSVSNGP